MATRDTKYRSLRPNEAFRWLRGAHKPARAALFLRHIGKIHVVDCVTRGHVGLCKYMSSDKYVLGNGTCHKPVDVFVLSQPCVQVERSLQMPKYLSEVVMYVVR